MADSYEVPIKCNNCGLHFTVWTWDEDWGKERDPHCPECGSTAHFIIWPAKVIDGFIFQKVPGESEAPVKISHVAFE